MPDGINLLTCTESMWTGDPEKCRWCGRGRVRGGAIFCSSTCKQGYELEHRYWKARAAALERDDWTCQVCRSKKQLTMDHMGEGLRAWPGVTYSTRSCAHHVASLETLCRRCHMKLNEFEQDREKLVRFAIEAWWVKWGRVFE